MTEQKKSAVALDKLQHFICGRSEPQMSADGADECLRHSSLDPSLQIVVCVRDKKQEPQIGVVLIGERVNRSSNHSPGSCTTTTATTGGAC